MPLAAPIIAVEGGGRPQPGKTIVITANGTVSFGLQPYFITKNMWYKDGQLTAEGETYEVTASDVNSRLELFQEITDGRNTAVVVGPSNGIDMVDYLGYIVTPTVVSPTDGSGSGDDFALRSDKITAVEELHLTVDSETNLDNPGFIGSVIMTAGDTNVDGSYAVATYTPFSSPITGVNTSGSTGDVIEVQNGTDMPYFSVGQEIAGKSGSVMAYANITANGDHAVSPNLSKRNNVTDGNNSTFFAFRQYNDESAYMEIYFGTFNGKTIYPKPGDVITITANSNSKSYRCFWGWNGAQTQQSVNIGTGKTSYTWTVPNNFNNSANGIRLSTSRKSDGVDDYVKVYTLTINGSLTGSYGSNGKYQATGVPVSITNINPEQRLFTVSKGASWSNGETFEGNPVTGTGEIESIDVDEDKINLSTSSGKWVGPNLAGVDFFVAGPIVNDTPLLTTDVELRCSPFKTDPADIANLSNIVWEIDGATENAGTSNPYKPTGLSPETTHTVRVKHQSVELEDSEWSATSSFTTGPSRSIYEYQQTQIAELLNRIQTLEGNSGSSY